MILLLYHLLFWLWRAAVLRWQREQPRRIHLQNEEIERVAYWLRRGELSDHCYRKAYQLRRYDGRVEIGMPRAAPAGDSETLFRRGLVGLYGYKLIDAEH